METNQLNNPVSTALWEDRYFSEQKNISEIKMAESVVNETVANLSAAVNETAKNATGRAASTPEGMFVAYSSLVVMALLPIFFGSFRSVKCLIEQKVCE